METVLVIDADSVLGRALCSELTKENYTVIAHVRSDRPVQFEEGVMVVSAQRAHDEIPVWNETLSPVNHIVFGQPDHHGPISAVGDFDALAEALEDQLTGFLSELQAAGNVLVRNTGGQIWVLTQEDSMQYYLQSPVQPIDNRARHAAVKSFAKEIFRFGVRANCANVQLLADQASPADWQAARDGLKAFAMRFKPNGAAAVARMLRHFLQQADLPVAGMVVPIGVGFAENNI